MPRKFMIALIGTSLPMALVLAETPRAAKAAEAERTRGANANFQMLDSDADGKLSRGEAAQDAKLAPRFADADGNGDGYLDDREYRQYARR
jgi:hypothetical protein